MDGSAAASGLRAPAERSGIVGILAELRREACNCRLCSGMTPHRKPRPDPTGTTATGCMLVAEAPAPCGSLLSETTRSVLDRAVRAMNDPRFRTVEDLFYVTCAVRCIPPHPAGPDRARPPSRAEWRMCSPYLRFEIRALHPRKIVTLGGRAAEAVLGRKVAIRTEHERRHRSGDAEVITLLAPSPHNRASLKALGLTLESYAARLAVLFESLATPSPRDGRCGPAGPGA